MTIISNGFSGTLNASTWAQGEAYRQPYVKTSAGFAVTAVGGQRAVTVAAGESYSSGVRVVADAATQVVLATPAQGQYFLIVCRRDWTTGTSSFISLAGPTTTTTTPTAAPTAPPSGLQTGAGVQEDQPLAWVWCNFTSTTVTTWDCRVVLSSGLPLVQTVAGLWLLRGQFSSQLAAVAADGQLYRYSGSTWTAWTTGVAISDVTGLSSALAAKADGSALTTTNTNLSNLTTTVGGKADQSALDTANTNLGNLTTTVTTQGVKLSHYSPAKITVQTAGTADPTTGNTVGDLLIEF